MSDYKTDRDDLHPADQSQDPTGSAGGPTQDGPHPQGDARQSGMERRRFLTLAGASLAAPFALSGWRIMASPSTTSGTVTETTTEPFVDTQLELTRQSLDFYDQAEAEAPFIYGDQAAFEQHWGEGRALYSDIQAELTGLGFYMERVVDPDLPPEDGTFPVDLTNPLPTAQEFLDDEALILADLEAVASSASSDARKVLAKLLAALGIKEASEAIFEILDEEGLIKALDDAIFSGKLSKIAEVLKKILRKMASKSFLKKLAEKIGIKAAARIGAKVTARFIPFLGWAVVIGSLLWAIGEQIFTE